MSIYAVIGSGFSEVPRREMNGSAHKAFPTITCNSCFGERQDAVNDLIKRLEDIVMNADDDVVNRKSIYTFLHLFILFFVLENYFIKKL